MYSLFSNYLKRIIILRNLNVKKENVQLHTKTIS